MSSFIDGHAMSKNYTPWASAIVASIMIISCRGQEDMRSSSTPAAPAGRCLLEIRYVQDEILSDQVWNHLFENGGHLVRDRAVGGALWYTEGRGRAAFEYLTPCSHAHPRLVQALEYFARTAPSAEVASVIRNSTGSIREITEDEYIRE